ncbi:MAG: hypothetical protein EP347_09990 [Alphaproteobacteria bacterium]|nr:MAG: hypothetical protein EP347_09990 [Alphaproteobacteria bacterium]
MGLSLTALAGYLAVALAGAIDFGKTFSMDLIETEDMRLLYFDPHQTHLTPYATRAFENSLAYQQNIFEWTPWEKTTLLLKDFTDYGNAAARSSPNDALVVDVAPLSRTYETFTAGERIYTLMNHELVHVATMDVWNKRDARWRNFFHGKPLAIGEHPESILYNYLATPRVNVPRWYLEGSAVFMETWMAGGLGRAKGGYDEMVFRAMVRDDAHFYSALGLVAEGTAVDFQVGVNAYLYGTRFMSYLALQYGPESVIEWLKRGEDSEAYYSKQFEKVFGKPLTVAWNDWIEWEHAFQRSNLKAINRKPVTKTTPLTERALGSVSRTYYLPETGELLGAFRYPGTVAHLGVLNPATGNIRKLTDIKGPMLYEVTSLAFDPKTNRAWYTTDNYAYRDVMEIDVATGKQKMITKDKRIGELVFNRADGSLWGLRHFNSYVSVMRKDANSDKWQELYSFPYGKIAYDMDISPDGRMIALSLATINGDQHLKIYDAEALRGGALEEVGEFAFATFVPESFAFSDDGRYLYGSAYYTGVSNILRYELATDEMEAMSNAETGFFRPIPLSDGQIIAYEYTGNGFRPVSFEGKIVDDLSTINLFGEVVQKLYPQLDRWGAGSPARIDFDEVVEKRGKYIPAKELGLGSAYPIIEGYKGYGSIGWHFNIEDPMQFNKLLVTASYSPTDSLDADERFHAYLGYITPFWSVEYRHNDADFYDLFGPRERARKGDSLQIAYGKALIYDKPRKLDLDVKLGYFTGLDTLPANQNVAATSDELINASLGLSFENTRKSLGSVDHEKGLEWEAVLSAANDTTDTMTKLRGGVNFGFALPVNHASIWFYNAAGVSDGPDTSPLTNFYFGAFGNNYVDDGAEKRYREYQSLPGFEFDEVSAGNFGKSTLELNLPPLRFREVGAPSLYLSWMRPALFATGLVADPGDDFERTLVSAGGQLDFHFTLAHRLPMTLSVGYAAGFEDGDKRGDEAMISLKIL